MNDLKTNWEAFQKGRKEGKKKREKRKKEGKKGQIEVWWGKKDVFAVMILGSFFKPGMGRLSKSIDNIHP